MPRYYCDYCDTYLTHDSPSVRKQHNAGYKHKANVRSYYQQFEEQQTQSLIDQKVKEHLGQTAAFQQQVGAAFHQHLAALQTGPQRPRLPVLPPPTLPVPGSAQALSNQLLLPTVRPPVLPRPTTSAPGYSASLGMAPTIRPPGAPVTSPPGIAQPNGLPRSPALTPPAPVATALRPATSTSGSAPMTNGLMSAPALSGAPVSYQNQQTNSVPTSGGYGTYNYPASSSSFSQQSTSSVPPNSAYAAQQPPRVPPLLAPVHSTASTPSSSGSAQDGYLYSQAPVSANPGNQSVLNSVGPPRGLSDF